jgi:hypothetical protein
MSVISAIHTFVPYKYITTHERGNAAITIALRAAKRLGHTTVFIPDTGGWMYYEPIAIKLGLVVKKIPTEDGFIDPKTIQSLNLKKTDILLLHANAGYFKKLPTKEYKDITSKIGVLFIEDVCGTFGYDVHGDIVLGSFGKAKPIDYGAGGFLATNLDEYAQEFKDHQIALENTELEQKILAVKSRLAFLYALRNQIATQLQQSGFKTIFDETAIVIITPYADESQKNAIVHILTKNNIEHTVCPRYIRSNKTAICAEIKRVAGGN